MLTIENAVNKEKRMHCPSIQCEYPGLAYFWPLDQLIVAAKSDPLHEVIGQKGTNYMIYNKDREKVFIALQKSSCTQYHLQVFNFYGNEIVRVKRKVYDKASIWAPEGDFVGTLDQGCFLKNTLTIKNSDGNVVLTIRSKERCPLVFTIQSEDQEIGEIRKKWLEMGSVDNFGLSFPIALDVKVKAVMLGACFLVAYLKY